MSRKVAYTHWANPRLVVAYRHRYDAWAVPHARVSVERNTMSREDALAQGYDILEPVPNQQPRIND